MAEQHLSIKVIFDKVLRHPLLQDLSIETIVDYSIDFMRIVGVPQIFENKIELFKVEKYRTSLPCDYYLMNQVREIDKEGNPIGVFRYSSDSFHTSNLKSDSQALTYKIQGGVIYTSIEECILELSYQAILLDDELYPLIPDNSSFTRALEAYIKKQHFTILYDLNKISGNVLHQTLQDYAWAVGDCQTEFNRMSLDKAESFYNSWRTLLIRPSEHKNGFINNGSQERLKLH